MLTVSARHIYGVIKIVYCLAMQISLEYRLTYVTVYKIMHRILVEKSVSITELRKNPALYLSGEPVAVLSNNRPAGYMMSPVVFEAIMDALLQHEKGKEVAGSFRPSAAQLLSIAQRGNDLLINASDQELSEFTL